MRIVLFKTEPKVVNLNQYNIQVLGLARALVNLGHICDIIFYNGKADSKVQEYPVENGIIKIYWLKGRNVLGNGFFEGYEDILKKYDVVQVTGYTQYLSWRLYTGNKYNVVLYQGPYVGSYAKKYTLKFKMFNLFFGRKSKLGVPVLTKNKSAAEDMKKVGFNNVSVVGVGLNEQHFKKPKITSYKKNRGTVFRILYIGRIEDRRNEIFMIDLMKELIYEGLNVELNIIGGGDKAYIKKCKQKVRKLNLDSNVLFLGKKVQTELSEYYCSSDLFILPTKYEIFGMVLLEAMYHGLPVITSDNGGSEVLIEDGVDGFIRALDVKQWAECIRKLYFDDNYAKAIGSKAQEKIEEQFLWKHRAQLFLKAYEEAVKN